MATDDSTNFLRLNSVDRNGSHIDLAAAEAVFPRALELGINLLVDSAVVANVLEEVAAEASLQHQKAEGKVKLSLNAKLSHAS